MTAATVAVGPRPFAFASCVTPCDWARRRCNLRRDIDTREAKSRMNLLEEIRLRFEPALAPMATDVGTLLDLIRPSQDAKFGDYQANFAMPLGKQLGRPPREIAQQIAEQVKLDDLCAGPPEIAGPGFINVRLSDTFLSSALASAFVDPRLGVPLASDPGVYIVDYSAPNVAKPMHVGHIRSTVIGDALARTLRFLGHQAIGDNHIGDWGTQFGMILYGYKNFRDEAAYREHPVAELARLYRLVNRLVEFYDARGALPELEAKLRAAEIALTQLAEPDAKKAAKEKRRLETRVVEAREALDAAQSKVTAVEADIVLDRLAKEHPQIGEAVLAETAKLHAGDAENRRLWEEFLPTCEEDIQRIYRRLGVTFDESLGESFYHDRLQGVVDDLKGRGIAAPSAGAMCVFNEGYETPFLIQKQDGAYLYATTDLATIQYRMQRWRPRGTLYVVDHRQGLHFEQLFATARRWGYDGLELKHVSFGTVLGDDGRPFKTRAGDTVGLEGLLDEAVSRAYEIVRTNDEGKPAGAELSEPERRHVAERVGIGALKYADLSQNRTSDYVFSYDKMLAMNGNTATYMQYAYARVRSIFAKGNIDIEALRRSPGTISLTNEAERALGLEILRFPEALAAVVADYRPNQLTSYLFELANKYSTFFEQCPVLRAESEALRTSRLMLCDLTARVIQQGLALLGIEVVEKM
jgi:arginyl-tRNA synthetase